jgi:hypothetical protein
MTPEEARRALTEWRDELEALRREADKKGFTIFPEFVGKAQALTYALSQVWVDREVAQAVLPALLDDIERAEWFERHELAGDPLDPKWQALATALAAGGK